MIAWRTHHTAYVMNLTFLPGSKRLAASMSPMFPSLMRSRNERPQPRYRFAYETTNRRFASTRRRNASLSPFRIFAPSSLSSRAVTRGRREISLRYFFRDSEPPPLLPRDSSRSSSIPPPVRVRRSITRGCGGAGGAAPLGTRSADRDTDRLLVSFPWLAERHAQHARAVLRVDGPTI